MTWDGLEREARTAVPHISLTFDDGPDPEWTPRLLDLLRTVGARATFFPIASRASQHPRLIERIVADAHLIGLHCDEHLRHSARTIDWGRRDTARALAMMGSVGARPSLWRTPYGDVASWTDRVAGENKLRIVGWTVDTHDWRGDSAEEMFRATATNLHDGAIVLAHDGIGPGALRTDVRETVRYVGLVADHADKAGLRLEPVR
jgi:peptidoglycan-N-acetylglucosamine deacetylase